MMARKNDLKNNTTLVHAGSMRSQFGEVSEALFLTQSYLYDDPDAALARFSGEDSEGFIYSRYGNPTVRMFEKRIAEYEGAEDAFATASGMSACFAALASQLKAGDHIVSANALFSSCLHIVSQILPSFGVEVTLIDGTDLEAWEKAVKPNTKVFFAEVMSNPRLEVTDVAGVSAIARKHGICFVLDNVFATPVLQNSLALGADVIFYSATKHIDGQGRVLGGVILGREEFIRGELETFIRHTGPSMSPFNAWVMLKGLETMELRVNAQADNALEIARMLEVRDDVNFVLYPGLASHPDHELAMKNMKKGGTMLAFEVAGGQERAFRFLEKLEMIGISNNLGDAKSLITHPATTTHYKLSDEDKEQLGISSGLIRLSVGIENASDLLGDLEQALAAS